MNQLSYALGIGIGRQLAQLSIPDFSIDDFVQSVKDCICGNKLAIDDTDAQKIINDFFEKKNEELTTLAKKEGENFLKGNAQKEGVVTLPSGLQYQVLRKGDGKKPAATDQVECHYEGTLIDGTKFDSSYDRGQTATFGLNQVIAGWTEGLQLMQEGAKYRFFIPYNLGYGEQGAGKTIPPYATLIFDVELIAVK
jgi:FKBP-type peptidyl-prolyl cis-trans isomerase FklB